MAEAQAMQAPASDTASNSLASAVLPRAESVQPPLTLALRHKVDNQQFDATAMMATAVSHMTYTMQTAVDNAIMRIEDKIDASKPKQCPFATIKIKDEWVKYVLEEDDLN